MSIAAPPPIIFELDGLRTLPRNPKVVTMKDVANYCNVTKMTVSRVLSNDRDHVGQDTIDRVTEAIRELGYDPSRQQAARRLALQKVGRKVHNQIIAFDYPTDFYFTVYFSRVLGGITAAVMQEKYALLSVAADIYHETSLHPAFSRGDVDGIISISPPHVFSAMLEALRSEMYFNDRPAVSMIYPVEGCSTVLVDYYNGGLQSARHVLDLGHRHMIHFGLALDHPASQRVLGYRQAMEERGLDPDVFLHYWDWPDSYTGLDTIPYIVNLLKDAFDAYPGITAILARNDGTAAKIKHALSCIGLSVPEDISLVGFDDTDPLCDDRGNNTLTTVRLPLHDVGKTAVEIIIDAVKMESTQTKTVVLPSELIVRSSTAPVSKSNPHYSRS